MNYPARTKIRLWFGRRWAKFKRSAAKRNLTTYTGLTLGGISVIAAAIIALVPLYFVARNLAEKIAVYSIIGAYFYQFFLSVYRSRRVDETTSDHTLERKLIERKIINAIHEHLREKRRLSEDPLLIRAVLEAMVYEVAMRVGGPAEIRKLDANLMIQPRDKPEYLRVIARYGNTRDVPKDYQMNERFCSIVWQGDLQKTAVARDIRVLAPERGRDVPYRDIISFPILDLTGRGVIASVNIDSKEAHHFPIDKKEIGAIEIEVTPYLSLLRMILAL